MEVFTSKHLNLPLKNFLKNIIDYPPKTFETTYLFTPPQNLRKDTLDYPPQTFVSTQLPPIRFFKKYFRLPSLNL